MNAEEYVNILVVDDRAENRLAVSAILEELGQNVILASSGKEALKCLLEDDFAVILMDVQMPVMNGFDTVRLIKEREKSRSIPVIFLTAIDKGEAYVFEGYSVGSVDYLFKPFNAHILRSKVAVFVDLYLKNRRINLLLREQISQLQQLDNLKDQFLGILSHELRTPVNAIMGFGSILEDGLAGPLNELQQNYVTKIMGGADTLLALVNDLLDMSQIQAGRFSLDPAPVDFSELVTNVLANLEPLAERKQLTLVADLGDAGLELCCDGQRIGQVLVNLVNNAIKFTPRGGVIRVRVRCDEKQLRCEVRDSGIGIAAGDFGKVFKRFTQLDSSRTRSAGGTGLGLSICKALIDSHRGEIGVTSELGEGSTFWFTLPLSAATGVPLESCGNMPALASGSEAAEGDGAASEPAAVSPPPTFLPLAPPVLELS